jgi:hypothetical protein
MEGKDKRFNAEERRNGGTEGLRLLHMVVVVAVAVA